MIEIIPAIDLRDGKCVRLRQGDFSQEKIYSEDPAAVAREFYESGFERLHVVDLDGAKDGLSINLPALKNIRQATSAIIDYSGGIRDSAARDAAFEAGADQIVVGTLAVSHPTTFLRWLEEVGGDKLVLSADVKEGIVATHGWQEESTLEIEEFILRFHGHGLKHVICTDIGRDGMLAGPNYELYSSLRERFPDVSIIASGGVSSKEELKMLDWMGVSGVIVGRAFYEGKIPRIPPMELLL